MITIDGLNFAYGKRDNLFSNLSLHLKPGGITGLLGKNGAGKTTLLKLMTGLAYPTSGVLKIGNHQPRKREPSFLADIFFVPEEFYLPSVSPSTFVRANSPFYPRFDHNAMKKLITDFELEDNKSIVEYSYGQKKKFLISFALATRCRFLILDEPTNGMDIPSKAIFRKAMAGALDDDQLVLISTHQVKDVENLIDNVVILADGRVILHHDLLDISSRFRFETTLSGEGDDVLYSETSPAGYRVIKRHVNGNSSVDIELLFNAVSCGTNLFPHE